MSRVINEKQPEGYLYSNVNVKTSQRNAIRNLELNNLAVLATEMKLYKEINFYSIIEKFPYEEAHLAINFDLVN